MSRKKSDPLISALIAKLPPAGADWPVDEQIKWLNLMAATVSMVYGGDAVKKFASEAQPQPTRTPAPAPQPAAPAVETSTPRPQPAPASAPQPPAAPAAAPADSAAE